MFRRHDRPLVILAVAFAGLVAVGALSAVAAGSAGSSFTLTFDGRHESVPVGTSFPLGLRHVGTFTSTGAFCPSGTAVDLQIGTTAGIPDRATRLLTCDDGSGSLTASVASVFAEHEPPFGAGWSVLEGTGNHAGLRGRGSYRGELLSGNPIDPSTVVFRSTWQGVVESDAVAPTIGFTRTAVKKLRRPVGAYALGLVLAIRDDVESNPVGYTVSVRGGRQELARKVGSTASGTVSLRLRVRPASSRTRLVRVLVQAVDPVGNERTAARSLTLR